jgi:hypothetical protein
VKIINRPTREMKQSASTLNLNLRLDKGKLNALQVEALKLGLTQDEMVSAIFDYEFPYDGFTVDESASIFLCIVGKLYPERWAALEPTYSRHRALVDQNDFEEQTSFRQRMAETITLTLPPAMVELMRATATRFPNLWSNFVRDCFMAVIDNLPNYLDDSYSFNSPAERLAALRFIKVASDKFARESAAAERAR